LKGIESLDQFRRVLAGERQFAFNGIILATTEDDQYDYFMRHWWNLDRGTGDNCRLFLLCGLPAREPPVAVAQMLTAMPIREGSSAAYDVARGLEIPRAKMPCIALFEGLPRNDQPISVIGLPPTVEIKSFLRATFDLIDEAAVQPSEKRLPSLDRKLGVRKVLSLARAPLADILERALGNRTASLLDSPRG
jgi:hypothetical protein